MASTLDALVRHMHSRMWGRNYTKIQKPNTSMKFLGVQWSGAFQDISSEEQAIAHYTSCHQDIYLVGLWVLKYCCDPYISRYRLVPLIGTQSQKGVWNIKAEVWAMLLLGLYELTDPMMLELSGVGNNTMWNLWPLLISSIFGHSCISKFNWFRFS